MSFGEWDLFCHISSVVESKIHKSIMFKIKTKQKCGGRGARVIEQKQLREEALSGKAAPLGDGVGFAAQRPTPTGHKTAFTLQNTASNKYA